MKNYSNDSNYFNRELSWIEFNRRVFSEGLQKTRPLLERLKFLSIASSNFDEFFMIRVASLKAEYLSGNYASCQTGMTPAQQLVRIYEEYRQMNELQIQCLREDILPALAQEGVRYFPLSELGQESTESLRARFMDEYFPLLTPLRISDDEPMTKSGNMRLYVGFLLRRNDQQDDKLSVIQLPPSVGRSFRLPAPEGEYHFTFLENLIISFAGVFFPGYEIAEYLVFRITRDADFAVDENRDGDFIEAMEEVLEGRLDSVAVRLSCSNTSATIRDILQKQLKLDNDEVFESAEPLGIGDFMDIVFIPGFEHLREEAWRPVETLPESEVFDVWDWITSQDRILVHPFDSFSPVIRLIEAAASDPGVLAIKMTLYRTSRQSPIVTALEQAARNGKQVTVLVELKARFDEQRNIQWVEKLEKAGVIVVYGIVELKVHAKAILIIRREEQSIHRYVHIGTGNYNEKTARLYTDIGILSSREELCYEVGLFFNAITGYSAIPSLKILSLAPHSLRSKILQLIQREIDKHSEENPSHIMAKLNALSDQQIIDALYSASQAGVRIDLNVRGICMLRPAVPGLSENIRVVSVVDHYLEHARAMSFHNGGNPEVFITSADWMNRNLDRRVELLLPVEDRNLADEIHFILKLYMNAPAYQLQENGEYRFTANEECQPVQQEMYQWSLKKKQGRESEQLTKLFNVRRRSPG